MEEKERLNKKVNILRNDIHFAERAYLLYKQVGTYSTEINGPDGKNFGELFGVIQDSLKVDVIMSVARLFDKPKSISIYHLLKYIEKNIKQLPEIIEKHMLFNEMKRHPNIFPFIDNNMKDDELSLVIVSCLHNELLLKEEYIKKVKSLRNKRIAHNDKAINIDKPTWDMINELLTTAKITIGIIGWAYLSIAFMHNGEYTLSFDAGRPSNALKRLLIELNIIERPY